MEFRYLIGVDTSKASLNYCIVDGKGIKQRECDVVNKPASILAFIDEVRELSQGPELSEWLLCIEHTGIYNKHLIELWMSAGGRLSVVPAHKISSLLGGDQGWDEKTDVLDARRIAEYGYRFSDKLVPYRLKSKTLQGLELLHRQRKRLLDIKNMLEVSLNEAAFFLSEDEVAVLAENQRRSVDAVRDDLKRIEKRLLALIAADDELKTLYDQVISVEGIGPVTAREILIATEGFTKFKPNEAKSFSRYVGACPKEWSSGTSLQKRRYSKRVNQRLKALLTQGARAVAGTNSELGQYYDRKREEGKPYLSVINALRNKIILRVFAVVRNQVMYEKNMNLYLDKP